MNKRRVWRWMTAGIALVLAGCASGYRVGELRTESESVERGDAEAVRVQIEMGAGDLEVTGGAQDLLEADFTYNVARLEPSVEYSDGELTVHQPEARGLPALEGLTGFRNEWVLRLSDGVPMDLSVTMGAGTSDLRLAGLALTGLNVDLGAGISTIDLTGDWANDLEAVIETGAADLTVRLPSDVGARVEVEAGPTAVSAPDLAQDGTVYTNTAYGSSDVNLRIEIHAGIGVITLELE
jgi:hypothetical protein